MCRHTLPERRRSLPPFRSLLICVSVERMSNETKQVPITLRYTKSGYRSNRITSTDTTTARATLDHVLVKQRIACGYGQRLLFI